MPIPLFLSKLTSSLFLVKPRKVTDKFMLNVVLFPVTYFVNNDARERVVLLSCCFFPVGSFRQV